MIGTSELFWEIRRRFPEYDRHELEVRSDASGVSLWIGPRQIWHADARELAYAMSLHGDRGLCRLLHEKTEAALRPPLMYAADDLGRPVEP